MNSLNFQGKFWLGTISSKTNHQKVPWNHQNLLRYICNYFRLTFSKILAFQKAGSTTKLLYFCFGFHYHEDKRIQLNMEKYEIWADFGPMGNTGRKKKFRDDYKELLRAFFIARKSCMISLLQFFFKFLLNFFLATNSLSIHNQLFIALLETPPNATFI